ncbi:MAG TPA: hypothetical protein DIV86_02140, partial [Alphaproteobacteria bacterium]|nr:hypothetical protein [Alphaproteobacteria bacterium]
MLIITAGITGIAWLSQSLKFIDFIVNKGLSLIKFLHLSALIIPSLLMVTLPISAFISVIYAFNKLSSESELIIFKAAGVNNYTLAKPALLFAVICSLLCYFVSLYLLPSSYREFKDMQNFVRNNYTSIMLQEGTFVNPSKDMTIFIKSRDISGNFSGLLMHNAKNPDNIVTMMAQEGYIEDGRDGPVFVLLNGSHQEMDSKTGKISLLYFDKYNLKMDFFQVISPSKRWREPEERYLNELFYPNDSAPEQKQKLFAEGHQRLIWPLVNFILVMLAAFPFLQGNFRRKGNIKNIVITSAIAVIFILLLIGFKNSANKHMSFVILMYLEVALSAFLLYLLVFRYSSTELEL